ncbi:hypothetical protein, partial [uncultured Rothia sp.]|uniref:hypothetical protein n=1 Tax=uncultured Rothia sp. TaxID=316088 RepID=UPI003216D695
APKAGALAKLRHTPQNAASTKKFSGISWIFPLLDPSENIRRGFLRKHASLFLMEWAIKMPDLRVPAGEAFIERG